MRLDIFVPFLKKAKKGIVQTPARALNRAARKVLPAALFSDLVTGKPGLARKWLKRFVALAELVDGIRVAYLLQSLDAHQPRRKQRHMSARKERDFVRNGLHRQMTP